MRGSLNALPDKAFDEKKPVPGLVLGESSHGAGHGPSSDGSTLQVRCLSERIPLQLKRQEMEGIGENLFVTKLEQKKSRVTEAFPRPVS